LIARAWNAELNSFVNKFGGDKVDSSLLILPEVGFVEATDPMFLGTLNLIEKTLRKGLFVVEEGNNHAHFLHTFRYILALSHQPSRREEARELFNKILGCLTSLGLVSETIDPRSLELWGNIPMSISTATLLACAVRLSKSWSKEV
jgi:GH15 family glucan-1,4-alpha-glucosidase